MDSMGINLSKLQEIVEDRGAWCVTGHRVIQGLRLMDKLPFLALDS